MKEIQSFLRSGSAFIGDGNGKSLESLGSVQGFMRKGGGFSDRSHESFDALIMRCGKTEKNLAGRLAKVQELVDVQRRNVVLLSRRVSPEQEVGGSVGGFEPEEPIQIGVSDAVRDSCLIEFCFLF